MPDRMMHVTALLLLQSSRAFAQSSASPSLLDGDLSQLIPILFVSFIVTWGVGLAPPLLIRYALVRRPLTRNLASWIAGACCVFFWMAFRIFNAAVDEKPGTGVVWIVIFFVARWIMSHEAPTVLAPGPLTQEHAVQKGAASARKPGWWLAALLPLLVVAAVLVGLAWKYMMNRPQGQVTTAPQVSTKPSAPLSTDPADYAGLSEDERMTGALFETRVEHDERGRAYMEGFSDPSFFSVTSKLRKIWGRATVIDGDTILLAREAVHIAGIDAPEIPQMCENKDTSLPFDAGAFALGKLKNFAGPEKAVVCYVDDEDQHAGTCFIWGLFGPINIGRMLVRQGAAWALPGLDSRYVREEGWAEGAAARASASSEENLWRSNCKPAWLWRKENNYEPDSPGLIPRKPGR